MSDQPEVVKFLEDSKELDKLDKIVGKHIKTIPKTRGGRDIKAKEIEDSMLKLKEKIKDDTNIGNKIRYNDLVVRLDEYYTSDEFRETYKNKKVLRPELELFENIPTRQVVERVEAIEERIGDAGGDVEEVEERKEGEEREEVKREEDDEDEITTEEEEEGIEYEPVPEINADEFPNEEEEKEEEKVEGEEEGKEEERVEIDAEGLSPEMEEFHNQIRKDERERVIKEFNIKIDNEDKIDIPKERLGTEGKSVEILNDDIKYFLKRFPDLLKLERNVYNKSDKKDRKLLVDIHRRIQAKLSSPQDEEKTKRIGIILDADAYIDSKINELLARKTLEGLTPANLVDITKEPKSIGKDVGSYTLTKMGGRDVVQNAPVYRAIPSTSDESEMEEDKEAKINQSTIYKNSGKTKVDIAKMELNTNPFIRRTRPQRLNIIL